MDSLRIINGYYRREKERARRMRRARRLARLAEKWGASLVAGRVRIVRGVR